MAPPISQVGMRVKFCISSGAVIEDVLIIAQISGYEFTQTYKAGCNLFLRGYYPGSIIKATVHSLPTFYNVNEALNDGEESPYRFDELLYHKPIKSLQKERVPINIVVGTNQHRKELSDDRKDCRNKYNRKSIWGNDPMQSEDSDIGDRNRDQHGNARDREQSNGGRA
jgi:hypothetical protein